MPDLYEEAAEMFGTDYDVEDAYGQAEAAFGPIDTSEDNSTDPDIDAFISSIDPPPEEIPSEQPPPGLEFDEADFDEAAKVTAPSTRQKRKVTTQEYIDLTAKSKTDKSINLSNYEPIAPPDPKDVEKAERKMAEDRARWADIGGRYLKSSQKTTPYSGFVGTDARLTEGAFAEQELRKLYPDAERGFLGKLADIPTKMTEGTSEAARKLFGGDGHLSQAEKYGKRIEGLIQAQSEIYHKKTAMAKMPGHIKDEQEAYSYFKVGRAQRDAMVKRYVNGEIGIDGSKIMSESEYKSLPSSLTGNRPYKNYVRNRQIFTEDMASEAVDQLVSDDSAFYEKQREDYGRLMESFIKPATDEANLQSGKDKFYTFLDTQDYTELTPEEERALANDATFQQELVEMGKVFVQDPDAIVKDLGMALIEDAPLFLLGLGGYKSLVGGIKKVQRLNRMAKLRKASPSLKVYERARKIEEAREKAKKTEKAFTKPSTGASVKEEFEMEIAGTAMVGPVKAKSQGHEYRMEQLVMDMTTVAAFSLPIAAVRGPFSTKMTKAQYRAATRNVKGMAGAERHPAIRKLLPMLHSLQKNTATEKISTKIHKPGDPGRYMEILPEGSDRPTGVFKEKVGGDVRIIDVKTRDQANELGYKHFPVGTHLAKGYADGSINLMPTAGPGTLIEEAVHWLQNTMESKVMQEGGQGPWTDLSSMIGTWERLTRHEARRAGVDIPTGRETFAQAFTSNVMGYSDLYGPEVHFMGVPDALAEEMLSLFGKDKDLMGRAFPSSKGVTPDMSGSLDDFSLQAIKREIDTKKTELKGAKLNKQRDRLRQEINDLIDQKALMEGWEAAPVLSNLDKKIAEVKADPEMKNLPALLETVKRELDEPVIRTDAERQGLQERYQTLIDDFQKQKVQKKNGVVSAWDEPGKIKSQVDEFKTAREKGESPVLRISSDEKNAPAVLEQLKDVDPPVKINEVAQEPSKYSDAVAGIPIKIGKEKVKFTKAAEKKFDRPLFKKDGSLNYSLEKTPFLVDPADLTDEQLEAVMRRTKSASIDNVRTTLKKKLETGGILRDSMWGKAIREAMGEDVEPKAVKKYEKIPTSPILWRGEKAKQGTYILGKGMYLSSDKSKAQMYGKPKAFVNAYPNNPLIINRGQYFNDWLLKESGERNIREFNKKHKIDEFVKSKGYDGVVDETNNEVVNYNPVDVKSFATKKEAQNYLKEQRTASASDIDAVNDALYQLQKPVDPRTRDENFKKWFAGSKVVDESGEPLIMYHGTRADFNKFEQKKGSDLGFHFGSKENAQGRLKGTRGFIHRPGVMADETMESIMPVYLKIKKPLKVNDPGYFGSGQISFVENLYDNGIYIEPGMSGKEIIKAIKKKGYDGLVYLNEGSDEGGGISYVAFDPVQIKSATGNIGTFDPKNPDIRYQLQRPEPTGNGYSDIWSKDKKGNKYMPFIPPEAGFNTASIEKVEGGFMLEVDGYNRGNFEVLEDAQREYALNYLRYTPEQLQGLSMSDAANIPKRADQIDINPYSRYIRLNGDERHKMRGAVRERIQHAVNNGYTDHDMTPDEIDNAVNQWVLTGDSQELARHGVDPQGLNAAASSELPREGYWNPGDKAQQKVRDENFKKWFAGSKVVDEDGAPLVVYHGTKGDFSAFDLDKANWSKAIYVTKSSKVASAESGFLNMDDFAGIVPKKELHRVNTQSSNIMPLYAKIKKPATKTDLEAAQNKVGEKEALQYLKKQGFDGVMSNQYEYLVFESSQLKSATGNIGTFDPKNPDIRYQLENWNLRTNQGNVDDVNITREGDKYMVKVRDYSRPFNDLADSRAHALSVLNDEYGEGFVDRGVSPGPIPPVVDGPNVAAKQKMPVDEGSLEKQQKLAKKDTPAQRLRNFAPLQSEVQYQLNKKFPGKSEEEGLSAQAFYLSPETRIEAFRRKAEYRFLPVETLQKRLGESERVIAEKSDAHLAETLYYGKVQAGIERADDNFVVPIENYMKQAKIDVDELGEFLYARHAPEVNERMDAMRSKSHSGPGDKKIKKFMKQVAASGKEQDKVFVKTVDRMRKAGFINKNKATGGLSGMTDDKVKEVMQRVAASGKAGDYEVLAKMVDRMHEARLRILKEGGVYGDDIINAYNNTYQYYVPLRGFADPDDPRAAGSQAVSMAGGFGSWGKDKRQTGRISRAANPVINSVIMLQDAIVKAEKNKVGRAFWNLAQQNADARTLMNGHDMPLFEFDKVETSAYVDGKGEIRYRDHRAMRPGKYEFPVKVDGEQRMLTINHDGLAHALKSMGDNNMPALLRGIARINRYLAAVNTSFTPEFVLSNFIRDAQTAGIHLSAEQGAKMAAKTMKDMVPAIHGIYGSLRKHKNAGGKWGEMFRRFQDAGGQTGFYSMKGFEQVQKEMASRLGQKGPLEKILDKPKKVLDLVSDVNSAVENGVRLAAFKNAIDAGFSDAKAAQLAKELTVNFNRRGESNLLNAMYLFYNASLQGNVRMLKSLLSTKQHKTKMFAGAIVASGIGLAQLNRAIGGKDDSGRDRWDAVPQHVKERNIVIMDWDGSGKYVKIPVPYGYNVFLALGNSISDMWAGHSPLKSAVDLSLATMSAFNPIGSQSSAEWETAVAKTATPTVFQPFIQHAFNEDYAGRPIRPIQNPYATRRPDSHQYKRSGRMATREFAQWLNERTGGSEHRSGSVDWSPETIDHYFDAVAGGTGAFFQNAGNFVYSSMKAVTGEEVDFHTNRIPFYRRFRGELWEGVNSGRYKTAQDELRQVYADRDVIRRHGDKKLRAQLVAAERMREVDETLSGAWKTYNEALDRGAPKTVTASLKKRISKIQDQFLKYYDEAYVFKKFD